MDSNMKRCIILENYQNPTNKGLIDDDRYIRSNTNNESCIDEINLMVLFDDGIIKDIKFDGEACAMCTSSTSIMINTLIGKTIPEAKEICKNFNYMLEEEEFNEEILGETIVYEDVSKQPNRKKCVLLPWWGIEKTIKEIESE